MSSCTKGSHSRREPHIDLCQMVSLLSLSLSSTQHIDDDGLSGHVLTKKVECNRRALPVGISLACFLIWQTQQKKNWVSDKSSAFMSYTLLNTFFFLGEASINKQRNIKRDFLSAARFCFVFVFLSIVYIVLLSDFRLPDFSLSLRNQNISHHFLRNEDCLQTKGN